MGIEEELTRMKRKLESLATKRDRARWEKEQLMKELSDKYGIQSLKEAEKKAEEFRQKAQSLQEEAHNLVNKIREKYNDLLEMV